MVTELVEGGGSQIDDSGFSGTTAETLPSVDADFSCKGGEVVNPDTVVDIKQNSQWVRLPVTGVEEWINKDGPADITRTAKVTFPMEWGGKSIMPFINGFGGHDNTSSGNSPYDECRIFFYDEDVEEWRITHYGYVGGVGPASDVGVGKMWVYDAADLMKGIQVSQSWGEPTIQNVVQFALTGQDAQGRDVGLEERSVFEDIDVSFIGLQDIPRRKQDSVRETISDDEFSIELGALGSFQIGGVVSDLLQWVNTNIVDPQLGAQKRFQINRHNMVDHMEWFTSLIDARWWFEPSEDGPILVIDATAYKEGGNKGNYERRYFVDESATEYWEGVQEDAKDEAIEDFIRESGVEIPDIEGVEQETNQYLPPSNYEVYATVDTLNNNALVDIKPFNTMYLYGESTTYRERYGGPATQPTPFRDEEQLEEDEEASTATNFREAASAGALTEEYPFVKVEYEPLLERSGGYEYSAQPIESDQVYLEEARGEALKEFRRHLAEQTEGTMELRGEPHIMPYDYIVTEPVCNDIYTNANATPIEWEVNGVKHTRKAGERYTTELGVSITVEERFLNTTAEYRET